MGYQQLGEVLGESKGTLMMPSSQPAQWEEQAPSGTPTPPPSAVTSWRPQGSDLASLSPVYLRASGDGSLWSAHSEGPERLEVGSEWVPPAAQH